MKISRPEGISQYDVVCLAPPLDPMQGLPLGNGDLGVLVWCEPRKLVLAVNKCDLWDDSPDEDGGLGGDFYRKMDRQTALRQACRVELDLGLPFMDTWYLKDFEARLDLAAGRVLVRAETPFGSLEAQVFVSGAARAVVLEYHLEGREKFAPRLVVERWGSRTFPRWYCVIQKDPSIGLDGTSVRVAEHDLIVEQQLRRMRFAVVTAVEDNKERLAPARSHGRAGWFEPSASIRHAGRVLLTVQNSEETEDPAREGQAVVAAARTKGIAALKTEHAEAWRRFWEHTHLRLGDRFAENFWHLALYYAESSQKGRYPGMFTHALWGWNRDYQPWLNYFHWNQQQLTWPLCEAGHPELMKPYLDYRHRTLDEARKEAAHSGRPGAWYRDVADRNGKQTCHDHNRTPGGQIAADFWRYYRFSGDTEYLREKGWPVIREVARWHKAILEKGPDGLYHATPACGYEGQNLLKDGTTELVTARRTFEVALATLEVLALDDPEAAGWRETMDHLAPLLTMPSLKEPGAEIFAAGRQKGIEKLHGKGQLWETGDEEEWRNPQLVCAHDPKKWGEMFSDIETSPVFPAGHIGLKDAGRRELALARATVKEAVRGWTHGIVLARLGMKEELSAYLRESVGFLTIAGHGAEANTDFGTIATVTDAALAPEDFAHKDNLTHPDWEKFRASSMPWRKWEFRRVGLESLYLFATAVNESLLQSYDGCIRIAPVACWERYSFTLWAEGGFRVSAWGDEKGVARVEIHSLRGGPCRVINPWPGQTAQLLDGLSREWREMSGETVAFETEPGADYVLAPDRSAAPPEEERPEVNRGPVVSANGKATLGIPRMF